MEPAEAFERLLDESWPPGPDSAHGNGSFGRWITDESGRPAYEYRMDQAADPRAAYRVTGGTSRDHWHLVGNDCIAATAHNGGYVQLYDWGRGPKCINRWDPDTRNYAGGFKFVDVDGQTFSTLWDHLPEGATQRRVFGQGYFEKATEFGGLTLTERIEAPQGDDPVLVSSTRLHNSRHTAREVTLVEFWGVNLWQLIVAPVMTHGIARLFEWPRRQVSRRFLMDAAWNGDTLQVGFRLRRPKRAPNRHKPTLSDYYPKTVFLAALAPLPEDFNAYAADGRAFFGEGGLENPPGLRGAADGRLFSSSSAYGANAVLALRRTVQLKPRSQVQFRYLYGYAGESRIPDLVGRHKTPPRPMPRPVLELVTPEAPWLRRELSWHSYYLQANAFYEEFAGAHFVDQGSAYSYLQGLAGAHRDFSLFVLPMVYLRPALAKDMLRFQMRAQNAKTGAFPYAHIGHGIATGFYIHNKSSDLDLFFFLALSEYLAATRDLAFLDEPVRFHPSSSGRSGTVLEHAEAAFRHLRDHVGVGRHGLLRIGTGDWNDQAQAFSRIPPVTVRRGESTFNAGFAAMALPALAGAIEEAAPAFAQELRAFADAQAQALRQCWRGDHASRGYLGYANAEIGGDALFLDAQPFGVLGGVWTAAQARRLFETVQAQCVDPQPAGALCMWPPMRGPLLQRGSDTNGGTWAAIDSWLAWAWSDVDPQAAWDFYCSTTLAARAEAYPDTWYGVWSGPDSYNAHYHPKPAETFNVSITPMTDFPVMNMNRHSGPLLDAIKLAGIRPRDGRIVIDPHLPFDRFALRLPLIGAAYLPRRHRGYYVPIVDGAFRFAVRLPAALDLRRASLRINGHATPIEQDGQGLVTFAVRGTVGERVSWELG